MTRALVVAALLAATTAARADIEIANDPPPPPAAPSPPGRPRPIGLFYKFGASKLPLDGQTVTALSLIGLGADVRVAGDLHAFAEYEWLHLGTETAASTASVSGDGHRLDVGLAHELIGTDKGEGRLYAGAEIGGGIGWYSLDPGPLPHAFAGIRLGFKIYSDEPGSTGAFGFALAVRAVAVRDGVGLGFTLGLNWGD